MAVLFPPQGPNHFVAMAGVGHEERFPPTKASGRCRFGQRTFAGASGSGGVAPKAAIPVEPI
jgi:hypothetical protein